MLQCKKERVSCYQAKLASLNVQSERRMTKSDATDAISLEMCGHQSQQDQTVEDRMSVECATYLKTTPARKRTQTYDINLPTRKSARLAGKNKPT